MTVKVSNLSIDNGSRLTLISGPCVIESKDLIHEVAGRIKEITDSLEIGYIFKSSFDKANRTSLSSHRGIGIDEGLEILLKVKKEFNLTTITDIHNESQCNLASKVVDILQIPAFLCRQTDLLIAAAKTDCVVNIKKGQFLAPWDIHQVVNKIKNSGNNKVLVTERGVSFGYNTLVSDMRALPELKKTNCPVIFDATHSVQQPGGKGISSGGQREFVSVLSRAAIAVGVAGLFIETHKDPDNAPSDGPNMVPLKELENLLKVLKDLDKISKQHI